MDLRSQGIDLRTFPWLASLDDRRAEPRYAPAGGEIAARVKDVDSGEDLQADLLDISNTGMRMAIDRGTGLKEGAKCLATLFPHGAEELRLQGVIKRVEQHSAITVIAIIF